MTTLLNMVMGSASAMERTIVQWQKPSDHAGHVAKLDVGFYSGSGEYGINYLCSCGGSFYLGSADPDLISDEVWSQNKEK